MLKITADNDGRTKISLNGVAIEDKCLSYEVRASPAQRAIVTLELLCEVDLEIENADIRLNKIKD